jgi:hypothetical protein
MFEVKLTSIQMLLLIIERDIYYIIFRGVFRG